MTLTAPPDEQVRSLASEILARSQYAHWRPHGTLDVFRTLLTWIEWLRDRLQALAVGRPVLYALLVGALCLVSVLLVAHLAYTVRRALRAHAPDAPRSPAVAPSFIGEAEALAHAGRFLDAAQRMQLAVIDLLLRRRVLELARSDPNRTLRQRLQRASLPPGDRRELLALLDRLERQWFRDRTNDRDLYDGWCRLHARLGTLPETA